MSAHAAKDVTARSSRNSNHDTPRWDWVVRVEKGPKTGVAGVCTIFEKVIEAPRVEIPTRVLKKLSKKVARRSPGCFLGAASASAMFALTRMTGVDFEEKESPGLEREESHGN